MKYLKQALCNPMLWIAIVYLLLPTDFIPDAVPVAGTLDDMLPVILSCVVQSLMFRQTGNNANIRK